MRPPVTPIRRACLVKYEKVCLALKCRAKSILISERQPYLDNKHAYFMKNGKNMLVCSSKKKLNMREKPTEKENTNFSRMKTTHKKTEINQVIRKKFNLVHKPQKHKMRRSKLKGLYSNMLNYYGIANQPPSKLNFPDF